MFMYIEQYKHIALCLNLHRECVSLFFVRICLNNNKNGTTKQLCGSVSSSNSTRAREREREKKNDNCICSVTLQYHKHISNIKHWIENAKSEKYT